MQLTQDESFDAICSALEALGACRVAAVASAGTYRSESWYLSTAGLRLEVIQRDDGVVTAQAEGGYPIEASRFLEITRSALNSAEVTHRPPD
jgi:hypothetical protein